MRPLEVWPQVGVGTHTVYGGVARRSVLNENGSSRGDDHEIAPLGPHILLLQAEKLPLH